MNAHSFSTHLLGKSPLNHHEIRRKPWLPPNRTWLCLQLILKCSCQRPDMAVENPRLIDDGDRWWYLRCMIYVWYYHLSVENHLYSRSYDRCMIHLIVWKKTDVFCSVLFPALRNCFPESIEKVKDLRANCMTSTANTLDNCKSSKCRFTDGWFNVGTRISSQCIWRRKVRIPTNPFLVGLCSFGGPLLVPNSLELRYVGNA